MFLWAFFSQETTEQITDYTGNYMILKVVSNFKNIIQKQRKHFSPITAGYINHRKFYCNGTHGTDRNAVFALIGTFKNCQNQKST